MFPLDFFACNKIYFPYRLGEITYISFQENKWARSFRMSVDPCRNLLYIQSYLPDNNIAPCEG